MLVNRLATLPLTFETVARDMDQVFNDIFGGVTENGKRLRMTESQAPVALWEDDRNIYLEIDVPGVRQEDLDLTTREGRLVIAGERKPVQKGDKCWYNEHWYGRFERVIALSDMVDTGSIEAELSQGVLHLTLHKKPEAQPQRITVHVPETAQQPRIPAQTESEACSTAECA